MSETIYTVGENIHRSDAVAVIGSMLQVWHDGPVAGRAGEDLLANEQAVLVDGAFFPYRTTGYVKVVEPTPERCDLCHAKLNSLHPYDCNGDECPKCHRRTLASAPIPPQLNVQEKDNLKAAKEDAARNSFPQLPIGAQDDSAGRPPSAANPLPMSYVPAPPHGIAHSDGPQTSHLPTAVNVCKHP